MGQVCGLACVCVDPWGLEDRRTRGRWALNRVESSRDRHHVDYDPNPLDLAFLKVSDWDFLGSLMGSHYHQTMNRLYYEDLSRLDRDHSTPQAFPWASWASFVAHHQKNLTTWVSSFQAFLVYRSPHLLDQTLGLT